MSNGNEESGRLAYVDVAGWEADVAGIFYGSPSYAVSQQLLNMPVSVLDLSVRAKNCLDSAGIRTVRELVRKSQFELLRGVRSFGKTSAREVQRKLASMGLFLGMKV